MALFTQKEFEYAERNGMTRQGVRNRHYRGWSHEDCWKKPPAYRGKQDKYPKEWLEKAAKRGISRQLVHCRVNKYGMDIKTACTTPPMWCSEYRTWGGIRVPTKAIEHGYSIGLTYSSMYQRIVDGGYAWEDACYNVSMDGIKSLEEL